MKRIGVEESLTNIQEALQENGYEVIQLKTEADAKNVDCCIVTGLDSNMMGMQDTFTQATVIDANGLSANDILNELEHKMNSSH
ncbi:YkuS family protein [Bacillus sp. 1P06AnD]|uniref:YkuS family protein n=1 Tax=Bacillus sp. 1P06AnD TaxID=3132208 RepID=UPI0039A0E2AB